ncbi:MAG TPA: ATP synthase subunit I [Burkholderiales bacterium]|nr:ATP synthase subunit I [Burkholderiales bacterium]
MREQLRYTSPALPGGVRFSKPIRTVLLWQVGATALLVALGALAAGSHGAVSAAAGGLVSTVACAASAWLAVLGKAKSAGGVLVGALRAEAVKIGLALLLLWLVLANYEAVVVMALLGAFVVTMLIFSMAFFVREY